MANALHFYGKAMWKVVFATSEEQEAIYWRKEMNWDQVKGKWKQARGEAKKQWGKLTDDELAMIDGQRDLLIGKVQEKYGIAREEAEKQVKKFESGFKL